LGKKVILIKDSDTKIISDLSGIQYMSYDKNASLNIFDKIKDALNDFNPRSGI